MPEKKRTQKETNGKNQSPSQPLDGVHAPAGEADDAPVEKVSVRVGSAATERPKADQGKAQPTGAPTSRLNRKALFIALGAAAFLVAVGLAAFIATRLGVPSPSATDESGNVNAIDPSLTATRLLDGTPSSPGTAVRWPIAVMIDNLAPARPQSGIGLARVVYETLAEGGTTRFLALYDGTENPSRLGPVRSSRHYFVNLAEEYHAAYVHAGQSPQSAAALKTSSVTDLNLIGSGGRYGYRVKERSAPHNLYTDDKLLTFALRDTKLLEKPATFAPWLFETEPALHSRPTNTLTVSVKFSSASSQADWRYDRNRNVFLRSTGGQAHVDALTNEQVVAKNLVVMHVPAETSLGEKGRIDLKVTGEGKAQIFRDGQAVAGIWKKPTLQDRLRFYDASGAEVSFHPGPTWIEVLPGDREVVVGNA